MKHLDEFAWAYIEGSPYGVAFIEVDKARALNWLAHEHPKNRYTPTLAEKYAKDMAMGNWPLTPEPITFDDNGVLINGGNRLRAVIIANARVAFCVWRGWGPDVFAVSDRGKPRTFVQGQQMAGGSVTNAEKQCVTAFLRLDTGATKAWPDSWLLQGVGVFAPAFAALPGVAALRAPRRIPFRVGVRVAIYVAWFSFPERSREFVEDLARAVAREDGIRCATRNFLRLYESAERSGTFGEREDVRAAAQALRMFDGPDRQFLKPSEDAWRFWRDNAQKALAPLVSLYRP